MAPLQRISAYALLFFTLTAIMSFSLNTGNNKIKFGSNNIAAAQTVNLTIKGTSTLHDWEMKSDKGRVEVVLGLAGNTKLTGLTGLKFSVEAESLKSEKTMMDNNAYKALKTNSAKYISFLATAATINQVNETTYQIRAFGK